MYYYLRRFLCKIGIHDYRERKCANPKPVCPNDYKHKRYVCEYCKKLKIRRI